MKEETNLVDKDVECEGEEYVKVDDDDIEDPGYEEQE